MKLHRRAMTEVRAVAEEIAFASPLPVNLAGEDERITRVGGQPYLRPATAGQKGLVISTAMPLPTGR
jgi:hypothetical protein